MKTARVMAKIAHDRARRNHRCIWYSSRQTRRRRSWRRMRGKVHQDLCRNTAAYPCHSCTRPELTSCKHESSATTSCTRSRRLMIHVCKRVWCCCQSHDPSTCLFRHRTHRRGQPITFRRSRQREPSIAVTPQRPHRKCNCRRDMKYQDRMSRTLRAAVRLVPFLTLHALDASRLLILGQFTAWTMTTCHVCGTTIVSISYLVTYPSKSPYR